MNEDRQYVSAVLAGNPEAYSFIVKKYQRCIYYLALRMLKNSENADEVTQKTFLKAYQALAGFQFQASLKTWLSAIALNLCRSELMRHRPETVELQDFLQGNDFDERQAGEELQYQRDHLETALARLPLRQKEVVMLRIYQELSFKEVALALKSTESAVKVNFHHALKSLKDWIQKKTPSSVNHS